MSEAASLYDHYWNAWLAGPRTEERLRTFTLSIVSKANLYCLLDQWEGISDCLRVYEHARDLCREEPFRTAYEHGMMLMALFIAQCHGRHGDHEQVITDTQAVLKTLEEGDRRRREVGMPQRFNSEIRYTALALLATAKWEGLAELRDRVMTVETQLEEFDRVVNRVESYLKDNPHSDPQHDDGIRINLAMAELEHCKVSARYLPAKLGARVSKFNKRNGASIALGVGHYRNSRPLKTGSSWYWDFELAKLYLSNQHTVDDIDYCHRMRVSTARVNYVPQLAQGIIVQWERQRRMLLERSGYGRDVAG